MQSRAVLSRLLTVRHRAGISQRRDDGVLMTAVPDPETTECRQQHRIAASPSPLTPTRRLDWPGASPHDGVIRPVHRGGRDGCAGAPAASWQHHARQLRRNRHRYAMLVTTAPQTTAMTCCAGASGERGRSRGDILLARSQTEHLAALTP